MEKCDMLSCEGAVYERELEMRVREKTATERDVEALAELRGLAALAF